MPLTIQEAIEQAMVDVPLTNHIRDDDMTRTKVDDAIGSIAKFKWSWVEHIVQQESERCSKSIIQ